MTRFFLLLGTLLPGVVVAQTMPEPVQPTPGYTARRLRQSSFDPHQTDLLGKGTWHVGLNVRGGYGDYIGTVGRITPRLSYFLKDGWSVSIEGQFEANGRNFTRNAVGLSTRYYFIRERRLALFGQAGANIGRSRLLYYDPYDALIRFKQAEGATAQLRLGLGVSYRLSKRWALEGMIEQVRTSAPEGVPQIGNGPTFSSWQGSLGVSFRLGK